MHQKHAIDRAIGERQFVLVHQRRQCRPRRRPFQHALPRRHESEATLGFFAKQAEIGRRITDTEHALASGVAPQRSDAATAKSPRHDAQALAIKIAQVNDIDRHGLELA
jgi:hypothetical protein